MESNVKYENNLLWAQSRRIVLSHFISHHLSLCVGNVLESCLMFTLTLLDSSRSSNCKIIPSFHFPFNTLRPTFSKDSVSRVISFICVLNTLKGWVSIQTYALLILVLSTSFVISGVLSNKQSCDITFESYSNVTEKKNGFTKFSNKNIIAFID